MEPLLNDEPDFALWVLLGQTRDLIRKARQRELNQYHIPVRQAFVLLLIKSLGDKATLGNIVQRMFQEPHSVSELLSRMERKGLVKRMRDLPRKNLRVKMTEKGQQAYDMSTKRETIHSIMLSLSEEESHHLKSCLEKLRARALQELGIGYKPYS